MIDLEGGKDFYKPENICHVWRGRPVVVLGECVSSFARLFKSSWIFFFNAKTLIFWGNAGEKNFNF
jgi:hypothetical protein